MNRNERFIKTSLELHLFFARIMKEHSLFLRAGFTPVDVSFSKEAEYFKDEFEKLLCQAVTVSEGVISKEVLNSGEFFTDFTLMAEKQTQCFTGIHIDKEITIKEMNLGCHQTFSMNIDIFRQVRCLNQTSLKLLNGLITLKETILSKVLSCQMFTMNYPLLLEHIIREAKLYRSYIQQLERNGCLDYQSMQQTESFWNQIMMEHALFIRGLLDATEVKLIDSADKFAKDYARLLSASCDAQDRIITTDSLNETIKFRDFKAAGTKGIEECDIRSIILPLLADHVLREANHYIRLLTSR